MLNGGNWGKCALPVERNFVASRSCCSAHSRGFIVSLCKVTHAEVQFCVRLSQHIRSHSPAVLLCCLKVFCQLDEPDKCTQPTDHHSSSGVAEFRHEYWTSTEPRCLWFAFVVTERLGSVWRWSLTFRSFFSSLLIHLQQAHCTLRWFMALDLGSFFLS